MKMRKKPLPLSAICAWEMRVNPILDYQHPPALHHPNAGRIVVEFINYLGYEGMKVYAV
jgi:hypothetical protein